MLQAIATPIKDDQASARHYRNSYVYMSTSPYLVDAQTKRIEIEENLWIISVPGRHVINNDSTTSRLKPNARSPSGISLRLLSQCRSPCPSQELFFPLLLKWSSLPHMQWASHLRRLFIFSSIHCCCHEAPPPPTYQSASMRILCDCNSYCTLGDAISWSSLRRLLDPCP